MKEPLKKIVHRDYFLGSSTKNAHSIYRVPVQAFPIIILYTIFYLLYIFIVFYFPHSHIFVMIDLTRSF